MLACGIDKEIASAVFASQRLERGSAHLARVPRRLWGRRRAVRNEPGPEPNACSSPYAGSHSFSRSGAATWR